MATQSPHSLPPVVGDPRRMAALRASGLLELQRDDRLDRLTRIAARAAGVSGAFFALLDNSNEILKSVAGNLPVTVGDRIPLEQTLCLRVLASGGPVVIDDLAVPQTGPADAFPDTGAIQAYMGVPFTDASGQILGACCLVSTTPRAWGSEAREALNDYAACVSDLMSAVLHPDEQAQAIRAEARRELNLARLTADVGYVLTSEMGLDDRLQRCAELVVEHVGAFFARVWVLDEAEQMLLLRASAGRYTHLDGGHSKVPVGAMKIGMIASERRPHLTNEVIGDPRVPEQEWAKREGLQGFAGYPLISGDRLLGVVALFSRHRLEPATTASLEAVATALALSIQRARVEAEVLASRERLDAIVSASLDCLVTIDADGRILSFNPAAETTFGHRASDVIGREMAEVMVPPQHRAAHRDGIRRVAAGGAPRVVGRRIEISALRSDGREFPVELAILGIPGTNPPQYAGFLRDISDRKKGEAERTRLLAREQSARLEAEASRERARFLAEAGRVLASSLTVDVLVRHGVRLAVPELAEAAGLFLGTSDGAFRLEHALDSFGRSPDLTPLLSAAAAEGGEPRGDQPEVLSPTGDFSSAFGVPISLRGERFGYLVLANYDASRAVGPAELDLGGELALRLAVAIDNARAHEDLEAQTAELAAQAESLEAQAAEMEETMAYQADLQEELESTNDALAEANRESESRRMAAEGGIEAARVAEARLRFLMENIPVQVWSARPDGGLDFVTQQTATHFGSTAEEVLEAGWLDVLHPDDIERTVAAWSHSLATGEPYEIEFRLRMGDSDVYRWFLVRAVPFRDEAGQIERWFGSNTDIEEKKETEAALSRASAAEHEANLAKSRFLNMLSHELRTPLGAIGGYADLLLMEIKGPINGEQRKQIEQLKLNQDHLYRLINDLLDLAKAEARQLPVAIEASHVQPLIDAALAIVQPLLEAKRLTVARRWEDDPVLAIDPKRVRQILINLLSNAIKFSPAGSDIVIDGCANGEEWVSLSVKDSGPGVEPAMAARIFEPFVQGAAGSAVEGTGLGLAISLELARAMGGDVTLRENGDAGAEFVLQMARAKD